ncbi:MAG: hypothetical protein QOH52_1279 [Pseudonocardiales bacterium]|nr:hypothetical protein [Pseudonocardiales bacterium]
MKQPKSTTYVSAQDLRALVPYLDAVCGLERGFRDLARYSQHPREHLPVDGGELLMMPASGPEGVGIKLLTLNPANPARGLPLINGTYLLFSPDTLVPEAVVDGAALTALRTAAVSALATRYLARENAHRLVVFGAGPQAAAHVQAMCAVRPIDHVTIVGTGSARTHELCAAIEADGMSCSLGTPADVASADIVCTCTTSATPLFPAALLRPDAHVNAVGSHRPDVRELDGELVGSVRVVVETRAAALAEAGDIILAISEGRLAAENLLELQDFICGDLAAKPGTATVFKSVGVAFEDLVVARVAADQATGSVARIASSS